MDVGFTIKQRVLKPAGVVFEAIADPDKLCAYFTKTASGRLEPQATTKRAWRAPTHTARAGSTCC